MGIRATIRNKFRANHTDPKGMAAANIPAEVDMQDVER
jgi:hypothetical protein